MIKRVEYSVLRQSLVSGNKMPPFQSNNPTNFYVIKTVLLLYFNFNRCPINIFSGLVSGLSCRLFREVLFLLNNVSDQVQIHKISRYDITCIIYIQTSFYGCQPWDVVTLYMIYAINSTVKTEAVSGRLIKCFNELTALGGSD